MSEYTNTSINMVQMVNNIIGGYGMGAIRALAQEPVQNARDAHRAKTVRVTYRLLRRNTLDGKHCSVLTITDRGTTGLRGPVLTPKDLQDREYRLKRYENWAAFEGHGYTKDNEDALGSRGQGKAAFLFHSFVPGEQRRMLMLYDTLLESGEYRLGVRYARPVDQVRYPPFKDNAARSAIQEKFYVAEENLLVPLSLEPLEHVGTRIIVPFLSEEARIALRNGELERWLQRCWWRAVQTKKLEITVVNEEDGWGRTICVPVWWKDLLQIPQKSGGRKVEEIRSGCHRLIQENVAIANSELVIKRLVLVHDENLAEDEIIHDQPEFAGIQLLRGQQWIETRGTANQDFGDFIPSEKRAGFRGFVEFDKSTESLMREIENSQHDGFDGRRGGFMSKIRDYLKKQVRDFAEEMGWEDRAAESQQEVSRREKQTLQRFVDTFLPTKQTLGHNGRSGNKDQNGEVGLCWDCQLFLEYPERDTARVNWGETIKNVCVLVEWEPADLWPGADNLVLELVSEVDAKEIWRGEVRDMPSGHERALGNWQVIKGKATPEQQQISCPEPGRYWLRAVVEQNGRRVAQAKRTFYVKCEPPSTPEKKPQTLSISLENASVPGQRRFDDGNIARLQINAKNREQQDVTVKVSARLGQAKLLLDSKLLRLPSTPAGDTPRRERAFFGELRLALPGNSQSTPDHLENLTLEAGVYTIQADLYDEAGTVVLASASQRLYFERDPQTAGSNLPFELSQIQAGSQSPMWELNTELDRLTYPREYPLWKELRDERRSRSPLAGKSAFTSEIIANGLLEWALRPLDAGEESNLEQLRGALQNQNGNSRLWDDYERRLDSLAKERGKGSFLEYSRVWRETVSVMLALFDGKEI